jgi:hypothetical protein
MPNSQKTGDTGDPPTRSDSWEGGQRGCLRTNSKVILKVFQRKFERYSVLKGRSKDVLFQRMV